MVDLNYWDNLMETDEHAAEYMDTYGEGPGYITRHTVSEFINNGESVLDVGCGPAWNYDHFREYGPKVVYRGEDYSERFVRVASRRILDKYGKFVIYKGDCRDLKHSDSSYDVVILQDCLEHTNGYEKPISEALRVARKRVIVSFWHLDGNEGTEHINDDGDDGYGAWYDKDKWETFLNSLPFVWHHLDIAPEGKTHKWHFYVIDKENS